MNSYQIDVMTRFSRRAALKAAGIGAAGFTLAQRDIIRTMAQEDDTIQDITATTERFGVTFLGYGLEANANGEFDTPWPDVVIAVVTAARAQEVFHLEVFEELGGTPLVDSFTVPPEFLTSFDAFFGAVVDQETREVAAQIVAMKTFTAEGRPDLAKVHFQYAAEEAEHRVLANYTRGARPAADRAFAEDPYDSVNEFLEALREIGIIEGEGTEITYPGPGEIDDSNVIETQPGGPAAECAPEGTPEATPEA